MCSGGPRQYLGLGPPGPSECQSRVSRGPGDASFREAVAEITAQNVRNGKTGIRIEQAETRSENAVSYKTWNRKQGQWVNANQKGASISHRLNGQAEEHPVPCRGCQAIQSLASSAGGRGYFS